MKLKFAISLFLVFVQATFASANECNNENICVGEQYYETYFLDGPHLVKVLGIQPDGRLVVQGDRNIGVSDNWKSSQLARTSGCNNENICVGEQYFESFYWDGPHAVTVVGIQSDGNPIVQVNKTRTLTKRMKSKHLTKIPKDYSPE